MSTSYARNPHQFRVRGKRGERHPFDFFPLTNIHKYRSHKRSAFIHFDLMQSRRQGMVRGK